MGPSILVGGISTFLGVVPLAFSTNDVTKVVFISFIAMVSLGIAHGLIFLPVLLSLVGPLSTHPRTPKRIEKWDLDKPEQEPSAAASDKLNEFISESATPGEELVREVCVQAFADTDVSQDAEKLDTPAESLVRDRNSTSDSEEKVEEDGYEKESSVSR